MNRLALWFRTKARRPRRGIRRLQQYVDHPGSRAVLDDFHQPRKEKPQP
ncbi:hypothetical protein ABZ915_17490 [Streptomyces sp. NPDC046915]